jgi:hypothetical protein
MPKGMLALLLERVEAWSEEAQRELLRAVDKIASRYEPVNELDDEERATSLKVWRRSSAARS